MIFDINNYSLLPQKILLELKRYEGRLKKEMYIEELYDCSSFQNLACRVNDWILTQNIRVYHCTKVLSKKDIELNGLRILDRSTYQNNFLNEVGNLFTEVEKAELKEIWEKYFHGTQENLRNGTIHFCISPELINDESTNSFFKYAGGEAINMPIDKDSEIAKKLEGLGTPIVVEFVLPADEIVPSDRLDKAILSYYHQSINPEARIFHSQGHIKRNVLAKEIKIKPSSGFRVNY